MIFMQSLKTFNVHHSNKQFRDFDDSDLIPIIGK